MRIALIVPGGVDRSGRERVIPALLCLIERLAARHRLLVIALEQEAAPASYELLGAQVINLGRSPARLPGFGFGQRLRQSLAALAAHGGADVIHAFWLGATSTLALGVGRWRNIPVVASIGGGELTWLPDIGYGGAGSWRHRQQVRLALRFAQAITGGSRFVLAPVLPIRPDARLVPLGVDVR
ncbi:MAG: glycosyltransferase, partial [Anaerolineae bacterium]